MEFALRLLRGSYRSVLAFSSSTSTSFRKLVRYYKMLNNMKYGDSKIHVKLIDSKIFT